MVLKATVSAGLVSGLLVLAACSASGGGGSPSASAHSGGADQATASAGAAPAGAGGAGTAAGVCGEVPPDTIAALFSALQTDGYPLQLHPDAATLRTCTGNAQVAAWGVNKAAGENPPVTISILPTVSFANNCGLGSLYGAGSASGVQLPGVASAVYIDRAANAAADTAGAYVCWPAGKGVVMIDLDPAGAPGSTQAATAVRAHALVKSALVKFASTVAPLIH